VPIQALVIQTCSPPWRKCDRPISRAIPKLRPPPGGPASNAGRQHPHHAAHAPFPLTVVRGEGCACGTPMATSTSTCWANIPPVSTATPIRDPAPPSTAP